MKIKPINDRMRGPLQEVVTAAAHVVAEQERIHDSGVWPTKYRAAFGAIAKLHYALNGLEAAMMVPAHLNEKQYTMMRHALGWDQGPDGKSKGGWRNSYCIYPDSDGFNEWCDLVERGLAEERAIPNSEGMVVFSVTEAGRKALEGE